MSNHLPPPEVSRTAYTTAADGWTRSTPWVRSTKPNHYEAIYKREKYGPQAAKVHVRTAYIVDATAAMFEINNQLRTANSQQRRRELKRKRTA